MIVPMRKLSLLIFHKDYQVFLEGLREKGVVHVHEDRKRSAEDEELKRKFMALKRIAELSKMFAKREGEEDAAFVAAWRRAETSREKLAVCRNLFGTGEDGATVEGDGMAVVDYWENVLARRGQIDQEEVALRKDAAVYAPWGKIPGERLAALREAGWTVRFYSVEEKKFRDEWTERFNAFVVCAERGMVYFITIQPESDEETPDADLVRFPTLTPAEIDARISGLQEERERLERNLDKAASVMIDFLKALKTQVLEESDMLKVKDASACLLDDKVVVLEGWVPEHLAAELDSWLAEQEVAYELTKPTAEDNPPVLLKNNRFARLFESLGALYSLPTYRELDLTPFFAPFFVLFFGFCLGDAGYGLLILLALTLAKRKVAPSLRPVCSLGQWLGLGTVVMGTVSGTFFGIGLMDVQIPWLERFKSIMLDSSRLFNLSLMIGAVQIVFGMCLKVVNLWRQFGFAAALSTIGWLVAILGGGLCYWLTTRGVNAEVVTYVVLAVAGLLVFVLNNLRRNVVVNIGAGLWDTYNMVTGLLGDVLSYIRLFALGISGSVLGLVFNDLAVNMSGDIPVLKQVIMLVILLFGHGVNLFMSGLGAFVHPMRLTFVEFYKNSGFEGGGKKYNPLRRR